VLVASMFQHDTSGLRATLPSLSSNSLTRAVCEHSLQMRGTPVLLLGTLLMVYITLSIPAVFSARCDRNHFPVTFVREKGCVPNGSGTLLALRRPVRSQAANRPVPFRKDHGEVRFWTKDEIQMRRVNISHTPEEFVATLAEHVPDRYQHAIRYFGLLSPGSKARTSAAVFALLGQQKQPRPRRLG